MSEAIHDEAGVRWSAVSLFGFRFVFVYLILYNFPFPLFYIPGVYRLLRWYQPALQYVVPWVGEKLLHLKSPITNFSYASGDKIYDYVLLLCFLVCALAVAFAWSMLDLKRANYEVVYAWLRVYVRFAVGAALVGYGSAKLFPSQFSRPVYVTLTEPIGQASPMGLLWTFMGASRPYSVLAGVAEFASGVLLFIPRTAVLGALLGAVIMSNVFALNLCYDVPVKLYSLHLLLMCLFVGWLGIKGILRLLVLNREIRPAMNADLFARKPWNQAFLGCQIVLGIFLAGTSFANVRRQTAEAQKHMSELPFAGSWKVDDFKIGGGEDRQGAVSDIPRWTQLVLDSPYVAVIQGDGGYRQVYHWTTDGEKKTLIFSHADNGADVMFQVEQPNADELMLTGRWSGLVVELHLHRIDMPRFVLLTRGFHFISEYPFNR